MSMIVQGPGGIEIEFPDGTDAATIDKVMRSAIAPDAPSTAMDVAKSAGTGVAKGVIGLLGLPGLAKDAIDAGLDYGISKGWLPQPSATPQQRAAALQAQPNLTPNAETIQKGVESVTGEFYKPQTTEGKYAQTIGEFAPNAIVPGGLIRRTAQTVVPAVASEYAGQATEGTKYEPYARVGAALAGGLTASGVESAIGRARATVPGMSPTATDVMLDSVQPGARQRLDDLGPQAFLFEGSEPTVTIAQGMATRPGQAQEHLNTAVRARNAGANARLTSDLDTHLGPAVAPSRVQQSLEQQRASLGDLYQQVTNLNEPVNLRHVADHLRIAIPQEAGATQLALRRVQDMVAPVVGPNGQRTVRTHPREVLNVRQALDDELVNLEKFPKAHAIVTQYRRAIDDALADAVPDIKVLDGTYANLSREIDALRSGQTVFRHGPEAIRPEDLIAQRQQMTMPQREAQRIGVRADIDRMVGTKANDVVALRRLVMDEGDWSRVKLAEIFGGQAADRIIKSIDREAAFQATYNKMIQNSQTAARLQGEKALPTRKVEAADLKGATIWGTALTGLQKGVNSVRNAVRNAKVNAVEDELSRVFTATGSARDKILRDIANAQSVRKKYQTPTRDFLVRAFLNAQAGSRQ